MGRGANDIAHGLAHFGAVHEEASHAPKSVSAAAEPAAIKKRRPVHSVKSNNLFADEMDIGGPRNPVFHNSGRQTALRYAVSASNQT